MINNNSSIEANAIWRALQPMVDKRITELTNSCVRRKKAVVTTAYNPTSQLIGITEGYGNEIFVPCVSTLSSVEVGTSVWVEYVYGASDMVVVSSGAGI